MDKVIGYILPNGSYGRASILPQGALAVSDGIISMLEENPGMLDIVVEGSQVRITPSLISYKAEALRLVTSQIATQMPSKEKMLDMHMAVTCDQGYFDPQARCMLSSVEAKEALTHMVNLSNTLAADLVEKENKINACLSPIDVDAILDEFQRRQGDT